jgi:hypothetical protein
MCIGFLIPRCLRRGYSFVSVKHPVMAGREDDVQNALENPDEIRQSKSDENVYLFCKAEREKRWIAQFPGKQAMQAF